MRDIEDHPQRSSDTVECISASAASSIYPGATVAIILRGGSTTGSRLLKCTNIVPSAEAAEYSCETEGTRKDKSRMSNFMSFLFFLDGGRAIRCADTRQTISTAPIHAFSSYLNHPNGKPSLSSVRTPHQHPRTRLTRWRGRHHHRCRPGMIYVVRFRHTHNRCISRELAGAQRFSLQKKVRRS